VRNVIFIAVTLCAVSPLAGCYGGQTLRTYSVAISGNPEHGKEVIEGYGCGSCHMIPGVHQANGLVGPPLIYFGRRTMIAGELPNTPANLVSWIEHPRQIEPKTAMPDLGLSDEQAYDAAAYLETLR
jgi:cytochrome c1